MKRIFLLGVLLLFVLACSKDKVTKLPEANYIHKSIASNEVYTLTLGQGSLVYEYLVGDVVVKPGESIVLGSGAYVVEARTLGINNGTYNVFSSWSDGYKGIYNSIVLDKSMMLEAYFYNATSIDFRSNTSHFAIEVEGYGVTHLDPIYSSLTVPTEAEVRVKAIAPEGYIFVSWGDGLRDITRSIVPIPFSNYEVIFEKLNLWKKELIYQKGDIVYYNNKEYIAKWVSQGEVPGENTYNAWEEVVYGNEWSATKEYQAGDIVIYEGKEYIAKWWTRGIVPTDKNSGFELKV